jgi:general secretion pathway protein D
MKSIKTVCLILLLSITLQANEQPLSISFKNLSIMDLVDITSKIINKNILITHQIKGKVDFISNKPLYKKDVVSVLVYVLEGKGFTLIENEGILRIVKLSETARYNAPVVYGKKDKNYFQMVTKVFSIANVNADYIQSKVRHLLSKSAKMVTDKETNVLIITDFLANIHTIQKVVELITQDQQKIIEVVELKNIQSSDANTTLRSVAKSMFNFKIPSEKVEIIANKENNSVTILGRAKNVMYLKKYIEDIDNKGNLVERVVDVIRLKNVESKNVIKILDAIIGKKKYLDPSRKPHASSDDESNSIVLMGPKNELRYIKELISKLDKDKLQVFVQAKIIEVSENRTKDIGLKYGFSTGKVNNAGIFSLGASLGGSVNTLGELDQYITKPTLTSGVALGATLNLLKNNQAIDVISEPSILCINNKESSIYVGETRSFQTGTTTGTTTTTNFKREDIGLTLKVKPRISNENKVTLEIETILEDAKEIKGDQTNPDTSKKEVKTSAIVTNGESVILGGLIKNKQDSIKDEVPFFSSVPLLGKLFENNRKVHDKINLVVIVTPYIIPKSKDLTFIRKHLDELKILEDQYYEDMKVRLKQRQLSLMKKNQERKEELEGLNEEIKDESLTISKKSVTAQQKHEQLLQENTGF